VIGVGVGIGFSKRRKNQSRVVVLDNFNRADNNTVMGTAETGQTWVAVIGDMGIRGNAAMQTTNKSDNVCVVESGVADCTIRAVTAGATNQSWIPFRVKDNRDFFVLRVSHNTGALTLQKRVNNITSTIATSGSLTGHVPGNQLSLEVKLQGNKIAVKINGNVAFALEVITDSDHISETNHGVGAGFASAGFDSFEVIV